MTHAGLSSEQRANVGISDGLLRLSVGLEAPESIRADLERALALSNPMRPTPLAASAPGSTSAASPSTPPVAIGKEVEPCKTSARLS